MRLLPLRRHRGPRQNPGRDRQLHPGRLRRRLHHELGLTHSHVHREFDVLKEALTEELLGLEKAKSTRALTLEERKIITRFKKLLDHAEEVIEKDIEQIPR